MSLAVNSTEGLANNTVPVHYRPLRLRILRSNKHKKKKKRGFVLFEMAFVMTAGETLHT